MRKLELKGKIVVILSFVLLAIFGFLGVAADGPEEKIAIILFGLALVVTLGLYGIALAIERVRLSGSEERQQKD